MSGIEQAIVERLEAIGADMNAGTAPAIALRPDRREGRNPGPFEVAPTGGSGRTASASVEFVAWH